MWYRGNYQPLNLSVFGWDPDCKHCQKLHRHLVLRTVHFISGDTVGLLNIVTYQIQLKNTWLRLLYMYQRNEHNWKRMREKICQTVHRSQERRLNDLQSKDCEGTLPVLVRCGGPDSRACCRHDDVCCQKWPINKLACCPCYLFVQHTFCNPRIAEIRLR